jgi:hypothetical protein
MSKLPDWVIDLVRQCASDDWSGVDRELDYPKVSPMFARLLPEMAETEEVTGYSSLELKACREGIDWLSKEHPAEYASLTWEFQRWKRKHMGRPDQHDANLQRAGALLAAYIDRICDN